jgi:transposase
MLSLTPTQSLLLAIQPIDFRKGIDSLVGLCRQQLQQDPFSGALFVFTNKNRTAIKALVYDGTGFWLFFKRFSSGKLKWWPGTQQDAERITSVELLILFNQGHPREARLSEPWRRVAKPLHQQTMPQDAHSSSPTSSDSTTVATRQDF